MSCMYRFRPASGDWKAPLKPSTRYSGLGNPAPAQAHFTRAAVGIVSKNAAQESNDLVPIPAL